MVAATTAQSWYSLNPSSADELVDARLQLHYAAQFATAIGISYLEHLADDSHTNLGWYTHLSALTSREAKSQSHSVRVAVQPRGLTLLVLVDGAIGQRIPLHGSTISQVEAALRAALSTAGFDSGRFTLARHYALPPHAVAGGRPFDASRTDHFDELAGWYANSAVLIEDLRKRIQGAEVRCWPHHFDIATLATFGPGRSSGAGMLPGDEMFPEPYFYVNAYPPPDASRTPPPLPPGGKWNADGWFGAVLPGSQLTADPLAQELQVRRFLDAAFVACSALLRGQ